MGNEQSKTEQRQTLLAMALEASALAPAQATQELGSKIRHGITATLVAGALGAGAAQGAGIDPPSAPPAAPALEAAALHTSAGQTHRFGDGLTPDGTAVVFMAEGDKADKTLFKELGEAVHQPPHSGAKGTSADLFQAVAELEELTLIPPARTAAKPNPAQQKFYQEIEKEVDRLTGGDTSKSVERMGAFNAAMKAFNAGVRKLGSSTKAIVTGGLTPKAEKTAPAADGHSIENAARATLKAASNPAPSTGTVPTRGAKASLRSQATAAQGTDSVAVAAKTPSRPAAPGSGMGM